MFKLVNKSNSVNIYHYCRDYITRQLRENHLKRFIYDDYFFLYVDRSFSKREIEKIESLEGIDFVKIIKRFYGRKTLFRIDIKYLYHPFFIRLLILYMRTFETRSKELLIDMMYNYGDVVYETIIKKWNDYDRISSSINENGELKANINNRLYYKKVIKSTINKW